jgi:surface antigen
MISRVGVGDELVKRTFRWNAPIIIGAGALVLLSLVPAPSPIKPIASGAKAEQASNEGKSSFRQLKAQLDWSDRIAALKALELALSELGDGTTLVWQRRERHLVGRIRPDSPFHDGNGRLCRHIVYSLALGAHQRRVEGNACREPDGSWSLSG